MQGASGGSPRAAATLLQLREASPGAAIRTRGQDAGRPGWSDHAADHVKGDLLAAADSFGIEEGEVCILLLHDLGRC